MSIHNINEELAAVGKAAPGVQVGDDTTDLVGFYGTTGVVQPTALTANAGTITAPSVSTVTAPLTDLTHTAPGTPDFTIATMTTSSPAGFTTVDEGQTVLQVIVRNAVIIAELVALEVEDRARIAELVTSQASDEVRIDELETKLQDLGLLA